MMRNKLLLAFIYVLATAASFAQRVPDWVNNKPTPTNNTYVYVIESAFGSTEIEARNQAIARIFQSTAMRLGQPISSDEINKAVQSGTSFEVISRNYNIPINKVCEYTEANSGIYHVYVLCQVAKAGNIPVVWDDFSACYEGVRKYYAADALTANGFSVYRNNVKLKEQDIRVLFANSQSYDLYDLGMRCRKSGWRKTINGLGIATLTVGVLVTLGVATDFIGDNEAYEKGYSENSGPTIGTGIGIVAAGLAGMLISTGWKAYGKAQIRKAVRLYNNGEMYSQNAIDINYGFYGTGAYLTFSF